MKKYIDLMIKIRYYLNKDVITYSTNDEDVDNDDGWT